MKRKKNQQLAYGVEISSHKYRLRLSRYYNLAKTISDFIGNSQKQYHLLDIGMGKGRSKMYLEIFDNAQNISFYAIDNSERRLDSVYKKHEWSLQKADAEDGIPFSDEKFDIVICEQVLEHLEKLDFVLREMERVLKPGGLLIIGVPIFPPLIYHLRKWIQPTFDRLFGINRSHIQSFCLSSIRRKIKNIPNIKIVEAVGFRIVSGGIVAFLENFRWWWRFNCYLGKFFAAFTTEIQIISRKQGGTS